MTNKLKLICLATAFFCLFATYSYALDGYSTLSTKKKDLIKKVITILDVTNNKESKKKIYGTLQNCLKKDGWYAQWVSNDNFDDLKSQKNRLCTLNIIHGNLFYSITYVHFENIDKLLTIIKKYGSLSKDDVLSIFNNWKEKNKYTVVNEKDKLAVLKTNDIFGYKYFYVPNEHSLLASSEYAIFNID